MALRVAPYPHLRLRRLRQSSSARSLFQENHLLPKDLIYPIFIRESTDLGIWSKSFQMKLKKPTD